MLSINTPKGKFPILYRIININIANHSLELGLTIEVNRSVNLKNNKVMHLSRYLEMEEKKLVELYSKDEKQLFRQLSENFSIKKELIDVVPTIFTLNHNLSINIESQLGFLRKEVETSLPIKAFLGHLKLQNLGRKSRPILILDKKVNIDQLRVIHNTLRDPVTYVQGPPGTGKTTTIRNVILSSLYNNNKVLLSSYNNKPVSDVYEKMTTIKYKGRAIPFPIIRLGNNEMVDAALDTMKTNYLGYKDYEIYQNSLTRNIETQISAMKQLYDLLNSYERRLELKAKIELIKELFSDDSFSMNYIIQSESEISDLTIELNSIKEVSNEEALNLLQFNEEKQLKWLNYTSISFIKKTGELGFGKLEEIILMDSKIETERKNRRKAFNEYIASDSGLRKFMQIYPVIVTTNLSSIRLGGPKPNFDLVILDEAGQCTISSSLLPLIRGDKLLLVGDAKQLQPIILIDSTINTKLKSVFKLSTDFA